MSGNSLSRIEAHIDRVQSDVRGHGNDIRTLKTTVDRSQQAVRRHDNDFRALHTMLSQLQRDVRELAKTISNLPKKVDLEAIKGRSTTLEHRMGEVEERLKRLDSKSK